LVNNLALKQTAV